MRTLTFLRASPGPSGLRISQPPSRSRSLPQSRGYSSLRPLLTLTHHHHHHHHQTAKRPTPLHHPTHPPHLHRLSSPPRRAFSALPLIETTIAASQSALTALHHLSGTPWAATIPLFALAISLATRLPAAVYARRVAVRRARATALAIARTHRDERERQEAMMRADSGERERRERTTPSMWTGTRVGNEKEMRRMRRRLGVQLWKDWAAGLAVFPVWLVGIEALRRMCGGPRGLLGSLMVGFKDRGEEEGTAATTASDGVGVSGAGEPASASASLAAGGGPGQEQVQEALAGAGAGLVDPTMATGGCLWFPDLTVPDPYHILPFALSAVIVLNMLPRSEVGMRTLLGMDKAAVVPMQSKWQLRLRRGLLLVGLAIGPVTMHLPAALHLYWLSSSALTWIVTDIIARLMPLPKPVPLPKPTLALFMVPAREEEKRKT